MPESAAVLVGRAQELEVLSARLSALRGGAGFALLLAGEPGIGKSALLDALAAEAGGERPRGGALAGEEGATVLRARGLEAESDLPFAAVRTLLAPVLHHRRRLPPLYARALAGALALEAPSASDRFAVAIALHALLAEAARERPVLALVDDLHWLDPASRDALLFAARRLGGAGVGLVLATREQEARAFDTAGIERLAIAPLEPAPARELVERADAEIAPAVREELVAAAGGNPLALLEVARSLSDEQRRGHAPLGAVLEPGPLMQAAFARRIAALEPGALEAATVAAAMERGPVAWLLEALAQRSVTELGSDSAAREASGAAAGAGEPLGRAAADALDAAERAGLVVVADDVASFSHPLIRAAAYHAATAAQRRAAHAALAATAPDPRRRAAHLSHAVAGADEAVAGELEEAAAHARAVGGHAEAGGAYARAAELSTDDAGRARRALEGAEDLAVAGDVERALRLLDLAERDGGDALTPAIVRLRGNLAMRRGEPEAALDLLVAEGERQLAAGAQAAGVALLLEASVAPMLDGHLDRQVELMDRARPAATALGGEPAALVELLDAEVLVVQGTDAPRAEALLAAAAERLPAIDLLAHSEIVGMAGQTAMWLGANALGERIVAAFVAAADEAGAVGRLPFPLSVRAQLGYRRGDWAAADRDADEAVRLAETTGQAMLHAFTLAIRGRLRAGRGEAQAARDDLDRALTLLGGEAPNIAVHAHAALGHAELVAGRPAEAIAPLLRAAELDTRLGLGELAGPMWAGDLLEALVAAGRADEAPPWIERAAAGTSRWARAMAARGRLLTSADDAATPALADAALAAHEGLDFPLERARTELLVGERLRRTRARAAAREPLGRALATFERLGAAPWAARARTELEASGAGESGGVGELTAEQRRIAELVAEGRTNREIAGELFVSEKTLERRLTQIYRRCGVASRLELARLVAQEAAA